ncbi:MAG: hypothetical protein R3E08_05165 [Thiotrichaceae bacterium]
MNLHHNKHFLILALKLTLPNAQFTVAQDNSVITLDSQGSTGVTFSPAQKASTIRNYQWFLDDILHFEGATDKMVLTSGKHMHHLKLFDSYGYTRKDSQASAATTTTAMGTGLNVQGGHLTSGVDFCCPVPYNSYIISIS